MASHHLRMAVASQWVAGTVGVAGRALAGLQDWRWQEGEELAVAYSGLGGAEGVVGSGMMGIVGDSLEGGTEVAATRTWGLEEAVAEVADMATNLLGVGLVVATRGSSYLLDQLPRGLQMFRPVDLMILGSLVGQLLNNETSTRGEIKIR